MKKLIVIAVILTTFCGADAFAQYSNPDQQRRLRDQSQSKDQTPAVSSGQSSDQTGTQGRSDGQFGVNNQNRMTNQNSGGGQRQDQGGNQYNDNRNHSGDQYDQRYSNGFNDRQGRSGNQYDQRNSNGYSEHQGHSANQYDQRNSSRYNDHGHEYGHHRRHQVCVWRYHRNRCYWSH